MGVRLDTTTIAVLDAYAEGAGISRSEAVRSLIDEALQGKGYLPRQDSSRTESRAA